MQSASTPAIGQWVARSVGPNRRGHFTTTMAHYVESLVDGDVVTRCGRRMAEAPGTWDVEPAGYPPHCLVCHG